MDDAVARAKKLDQARLTAWVGCEVILGRRVRPFSLRAWIMLIESNNAFVTGAIPLTGDVMQFLWLVDPEFDGHNQPSKVWMKNTAWGNQHAHAVEDIALYLERALHDLPRGARTGSGIEIASFVAYWVHRFASDYGWSCEDILKSPLQQLIQMERVGREARGDAGAQQTDLVLAMIRRSRERAEKEAAV